MNYSLYYFDEGQYSVPMTLKQARRLKGQFEFACIVNIRTGEVID